MAQAKITWPRLQQIRRRQPKVQWSPNYTAATFADPREAPGISTGTILRAKKLGSRELHTLSFSETCAAFLAVYNPNCFEVFDQLAMSTTPCPHLLFGHQHAAGLTLASFRGTLDVADRLGTLSKHPRIRAKIGPDPATWPIVPFPYVADLTLCLVDDGGPYVVDWPIKDKYEDFRRRGPRKSRSRPDEDDPAVVSRTLLQRTFFSDAGIRSIEVVGRSIDFHVRCNLRELFLEESYPVTLSEPARVEVMSMCRENVGRDIPGYLLARQIARDHRIDEREAAALIKQGVWRRELRVDLFQPVLMDKPLRPEKIDVLSHYADWFKR
jgi:hypothetical protein